MRTIGEKKGGLGESGRGEDDRFITLAPMVWELEKKWADWRLEGRYTDFREHR